MADNENTSVTKDLGIVSAYGYAKAAGYTGTEEEFEQIFLEFTEDAPGLLDRLDEAVSDCEDAASDAADAKTAAENAQTAAEAAAATFETDTTLAVSGKAADAKVTGDEITGLKTAITQTNNLERSEIQYSSAGNGYINSDTGDVVVASGYSHTDYIDLTKYNSITYSRISITSTATHYYGIAFYDVNKTYISGIRPLNNQQAAGYTLYETIMPFNAVYARFSYFTSAETYGAFELFGTSKLVGAVANSEYNVYSEIGSTSASCLFYIAGANSLLGLPYRFKEAHIKMIHPSGATSENAKGVGALITVEHTDSTISNVLANQNIFAQVHSAAHKMELDFNVFATPYKVLGTIDYYVDNVFNKRFDVNITSEKEIDKLFAFGGYFNTGTYSKTYTVEGKLSASPNVVVTN